MSVHEECTLHGIVLFAVNVLMLFVNLQSTQIFRKTTKTSKSMIIIFHGCIKTLLTMIENE